MIAVLLPPTLGASTRLPGLADGLPDHGFTPVRPEVDGDDRPPYGTRYVARASLEINRLVAPQAPTALVAEGGSGPLVGAVGQAQRAAHRPVFGYVLVDAFLPQPGTPTRADIVRSQSPEGVEAGTDVEEEPDGYRTEPLPMLSDWPDAPCGYVLTDPDLAHVARLAELRGWTVRRTAPEKASETLAGLLTDLRGMA
ncbi:hypothetical protein [Nocardiopsis sp. ATB16-24]|uniref:hypothetical protein n=1 Tax=Nocardiopsis sp. ATB16-24 TaxID=3019555 RepID=UPI002552532C|nr:hypothetical protein [Nocardiopsis sp. ATB16-24]